MACDESYQANSTTTGDWAMRFLKADFYRTFAIGFALGAIVVFTVMDGSNDSMVPSAIAAPATGE